MASKCSCRLIPSLRQSVATKTCFLDSHSCRIVSTRDSGGNNPVTAITSTSFGKRVRSSAATYSAVGMKRQNIIGWYPSLSRPLIRSTALFNFSSFSPNKSSAARAISNKRRRFRCPSSSSPPGSEPGVTSEPSADSSTIISRIVRRPISSASSGFSASAGAARLRKVAAAAAGLEASERNNAKADHQRTR